MSILNIFNKRKFKDVLRDKSKMNPTINLHIHTTHSDGGNTTAEIVAMLKEAGVTAFAITDHDNIDGNFEAAKLAKKYRLTYISGIELSCCFADGEIGLDESWVIHILGYGFDFGLMREKLSELENRKHEQMLELFNLLVADGYNIELERISQDGKIPERTAISEELIRNGYAVDDNECFSKILNTDRYRAFAKYKPTIKEGIEIIHACGGLAVWAHPFDVTRGGKKDLTQEQVSELLFKMLKYECDGIEVYYQRYTSEQINWLNNNAESFWFYKTVGTDYHNVPVDLVDLTKYPEYTEFKKRERIAFDVTLPDVGAEAILRRIISPNESSYPYKNVYSYHKYRFNCSACDWEGLGSETVEVGDIENSYGVGCPKCRVPIQFVSYPSNWQIIKYDTPERKDQARKWQAEDEARSARWEKEYKEYPNLSSSEQLPDIDATDIIISLREEGPKTDWGGCKFIVLYYDETEIWRELNSFEFYRKYLRIGRILKEKYGDRLYDFEVEYTWALGGDAMGAFCKVRAFRKSLSGRDDMSDKEFDYITKSGHFSPKDAMLWKALEFARERHAGQTRNEGTPYFTHIEGVIDVLIKCGKMSDYLLTIAALHDILEDTETTKDELYALLRSYPGDEYIAKFADHNQGAEVYDQLNNGECRNVIAEVELLTHKSEDTFKEYIDRIFQDDSIKRERHYLSNYNGAKFVKLADRLHNLSTLHLCSDPEKIQRKILETEELIMPWRNKHPECEDLFALIEEELESAKRKIKGNLENP